MPVPGEMSAAFFSLAEALEVMRQEGGDAAVEQGSEGHDSIINRMIETLLNDARAPPREVEGVSEEFCDGTYISFLPSFIAKGRGQLLTSTGKALDRVPRTSLQPTQICPICNNPFLEDEYPLVVRLPCHPAHMFDLECVRPWLRLRGTCPLDRRDFAKQEREKVEASRQRVVDDEEEDDMDGMYG